MEYSKLERAKYRRNLLEAPKNRDDLGRHTLRVYRLRLPSLGDTDYKLGKIKERLMRVAAAIVISVLGIALAHGQTYEENSANFIFLGCKTFAEGQTRTINDVSAGNYCSGILNALAGVSALLPTALRSCIPPDVTARQEAWVVVRYLENNAALMNKDFRTLTLYAYQQAWPCGAQH